MVKRFLIFVCVVFFITGCDEKKNDKFCVDAQIEYCLSQALKTLALIPGDSLFPRNIDSGQTQWRFVDYRDWTSGFFPGILWYLYEYSGDESWMHEADRFSSFLYPLSQGPANDHDLGFQIFSSYGNGYRLTGNEQYKEIIINTSHVLGSLFNENVGTILSWPGMVKRMNWPHNTIIDNMMNLEMLLWAAENGAGKSLYDLSLSHADVTMKHQFRDDYSTYHVVVYDDDSGEAIGHYTHQGYADETMWARGQSWAIYGYMMIYRETGLDKYLDVACKAADIYLERLPSDLIPFWDFDAPGIPDEPRDASAAAITASALLQLSDLIPESKKSVHYYDLAVQMLRELSENYQSGEKNSAFLMHSVGHIPNGYEVDASINYADYYYLEALMQLRRMQAGHS